MQILPCENNSFNSSPAMKSDSSSSSAAGYIDFNDIITEETPITIPRDKN